ncbi:1-(5-phosphoribosyl)-5-[(5-phosphoribosylamino)methylideneamino] imidazole-4-carboxamide isomerase [Shimia sp.]|uniref:1-(5-phosphoribosyl)-5-[(5- phosphoribosylamino)methylideneamino]imidazole-4- carboxamide isomerase n=1 Tax=Shimia sp. TaxID=1954381 RepID=UPI003298F80E
MIIYPTIELMGGKCVSLTRGRLSEASIWHVDPVETARGFAQAGASWMHVTDLDRVAGADHDNGALIEEIIRAAGIPVQLGGGIRSRDHVQDWLDKGVGRVVIGTAAIQDPSLVRDMAKFHPDQIVLAIDVFQGQLMSHGWQETSAIQPADVINAFEDSPLAGVIVTDIDSDIEDNDGQLGVISGLAAQTRHPVIARGTVRSADDVSRLKFVPNISGTLIGRALFSREIDLGDALALVQSETSTTAAFI